MSIENSGGTPFGLNMPDWHFENADDLVKAKAELLEASHGYPINELGFGDELTFLTDPGVNGRDCRLTVKLIQRPAQQAIGPHESVRVKVTDSSFDSILKDGYFELEGASLGGFMTSKGVIRRHCNVMLSPVTMHDFHTTPFGRSSDEELERLCEKGVLEFHHGFYLLPETTYPSMELPPVNKLVRVPSGSEGREELTWLPPKRQEPYL